MESKDCRALLPGAVHEIETAWIPLSDGCRLAARIWLPACTKERPVGAVMEYIPYRRRDLSRSRDEPMHRYFAERGYASLRVDLRGSGDSDGLLEDEWASIVKPSCVTAPELPDAAGTGCFTAGPWAANVTGPYWTSTTNAAAWCCTLRGRTNPKCFTKLACKGAGV